MRVIVIARPAVSPVSLDAAKRQCRATGFTDDDALIQEHIDTATYWLDGPDGWLGRCLVTQQLQASLDAFPPFMNDAQHVYMEPWEAYWIKLPYRPIQSVDEITYVDTSGQVQTLDPSLYQLNGFVLEPTFGACWPATRFQRAAVKIKYTAGYGLPTGDTLALNPVPPPVRQAIRLLVSHWYNHPDAVVGVELRDSSAELPLGVESLLGTLRLWDA